MKLKLLVAGLVLTTAFTSCSKDEVTNPSDDATLKTATVIGNIKANYDLRNDDPTLTLEAVSGVEVIATMAGEDQVYNSDPNYEYPAISYTTTTDANGEFSITVELLEKGTKVFFQFSDVYLDKQRDGGGTDVDVEFSKIGGNLSVDLVPGQTVIEEVLFND